MFEWQLPWIFYLAPLPWLIRCLPKTHRQGIYLIVPFAQQLVASQKEQSPYTILTSRLPLYLLSALLWLLLLTSAAQPTVIDTRSQLPTSGRDLLLAVDISGSMREKDMQTASGDFISRLQAMKIVLSDFIEQRRGDRIGLILFGDQAYVQVPLTFDVDTVKQLLNEARIGFAGKATAIGDAIGLSVKRLIERRNTYNTADSMIILLTDGSNTTGTEPLAAAEIAHQLGVKVYTIGIGADKAQRRTIFGFSRQNTHTAIDEAVLTSIANITQATYYRAQNSVELKNIYGIIDSLEPIPEDITLYLQRPLFHWPLAAAFVISMLLALGIIVHKRTTP